MTDLQFKFDDVGRLGWADVDIVIPKVGTLILEYNPETKSVQYYGVDLDDKVIDLLDAAWGLTPAPEGEKNV